MPKLAVRILTLAILMISLSITPILTQVSAATASHKHMKKHARVVQQGPRVKDPGANPFASSYDNDFDRKNAGGAGGY